VASRNHLALLPGLVRDVLLEANLSVGEIDAFAATTGPGLAAALLVGASAAKGLALGAGRPFFAINHLEGHVLSPFFGQNEIPGHTALIVSGGHTLLVDVEGYGRYRLLGRTLDDAAGEAFDKVAKLLGLGYPGGPAIELAAQGGNASAIRFPTASMSDGAPDFSFSGIKTAVSLHVRKSGALSPAEVADVAASFQATVVKTLVRKSLRAGQRLGIRRLVLTGGVAANTALRQALGAECGERGWELFIPSRALCTDNAAMIGAAGHDRLEAGERAPLTMNADPGMALA
jgi:putative glycoprotease GCP